MKKGWKETRLEEICNKTINIKWENHSEKYFKYIDLSSVSRKTLAVTEHQMVNSKNAPSRAKKIIHTDDVIFATTRPTLRRAAIIKKEYNQNICSTGFCVLRAKKEKVVPEFVFYVLISNKFMEYIEELQKGASYPAVTDYEVKKHEVYLPSVDEQKRIVSILDKAFAAIDKAKENAEKNLRNAQELFESYLQSVFADPGNEWKEKKLREVCGISSKLVDPRDAQYIDLLHVGGANIESNTGNLIEIKTAKEEKLISGKFVFDKNMILYSKIRPYLMKIVRPDFVGLCSADIYPLKPKSTLKRDFLYYLLSTKTFTEFAIKGSDRAGMPKVNRAYLFGFSFMLPPISEQCGIVAKLDALSAKTKKLEVIYQQKLADLKELKQSILQKAFNGELSKAS